MLQILKYGRPNRRIIIEQPTDAIANSGQKTKTWTEFKKVWAERIYNKGFDTERSDRFEVATNYKYKMDGWDTTITTSMRVNDNSKYYYIHNIEPLGLNQGTILYVDGRDHNEYTE